MPERRRQGDERYSTNDADDSAVSAAVVSLTSLSVGGLSVREEADDSTALTSLELVSVDASGSVDTLDAEELLAETGACA